LILPPLNLPLPDYSNLKTLPMRKHYTLLVSAWILSFLSFELIAQPSPDWTRSYAGPTGKGAAGRVIEVVNGFVYSAGAGDGVHIVRYDTQNPLLPGLVMSYLNAEYAYDLAVDASGNVYVAARSKASLKGNSVPNYDYITIKFKPDGSLHWARTYAGSRGAADCPQALAVDNIGNVYVTGGAEGINASNAFAAAVTLKYNSNGDLQWVARMDEINPGEIAVAGSPYESGQALTIDGNGDVYITGESNRRVFIAKYAGNYTGSGLNPVIWKDEITEGTSGRTIGISNGNVIACGFGGALTSYSTAGARNWVRKYGSDLWDMALSSSAIYATGRAGRDMYTVKCDLQGNMQWGNSFNASTNTAFARAVTFDDCGNVFITGNISVPEGRNLVNKLPVVKYRESGGNPDWVTYNGTDGFDIATDPSGAVYVTGVQNQKTLQNMITAKYPAGCVPPAQSVSPFSTMEENVLNSVNNFPNPFKLSTNISFRLAKAGFVSLNVYDLSGRKVQTLIQEKRNAGHHSVKFSGNNLAAGTYIYRLEADGYSKTGRMILEK
jgi:Secretion system C-terminal sorting domain